MEKRNIALAIVFSLITFGIYSLYWFYKLTNEMHEALGYQNTSTGGWAVVYSIVTLGIYTFYWNYKMGEGVDEISERYGLRKSSNTGLIYLLLSIFGLGIISTCLIQDKLNDVVELNSKVL